MALLAGGPTLVGSLVGHAVTTKATSVMLLTLAAGSILYVAIGLLGLASRRSMVIQLQARIARVRQPMVGSPRALLPAGPRR